MPSNDFYDSTGYPSNGTLGVAATMRSELDLIEAGFNKLPGLAASASLPIFGNSGGTALEPKSAADARTLLDVYSKAETPTLPVGCIVAFVGGYFTNTANAGFTNVIGNTALAVNTLLNSSGWYVCNGAAINIPTSSIFNGANRYLPNLSDSRFLMGSTGAGTIGGATSSAHTHTISSCTLSLDQIPSHTHTVSLNQLGNSGAANSILNVIRGKRKGKRLTLI
jgi:hypothetical protein